MPSAKYNKTMQDLVRRLLVELGEDPDREGLAKTPKRVDAALRFLTSGYSADVDEVLPRVDLAGDLRRVVDPAGAAPVLADRVVVARVPCLREVQRVDVDDVGQQVAEDDVAVPQPEDACRRHELHLAQLQRLSAQQSTQPGPTSQSQDDAEKQHTKQYDWLKQYQFHQ